MYQTWRRVVSEVSYHVFNSYHDVDPVSVNTPLTYPVLLSSDDSRSQPPAEQFIVIVRMHNRESSDWVRKERNVSQLELMMGVLSPFPTKILPNACGAILISEGQFPSARLCPFAHQDPVLCSAAQLVSEGFPMTPPCQGTYIVYDLGPCRDTLEWNSKPLLDILSGDLATQREFTIMSLSRRLSRRYLNMGLSLMVTQADHT